MDTGFLVSKAKAHLYYSFSFHSNRSPTLVFLNGLNDDTECWQPLLELMSAPYNILRVDLMGQGLALQKDLDVGLNLHYAFTAEEQAEALSQIVKHLEIKKPFNLIGFSYGGGIAMEFARKHPDKVDRLLLWLPYIIRLDQAYLMQRLWSRQFKMIKSIPGPTQVGCKIFENIYDTFLHQYMHNRYQARIPNIVLRETAVQLSEGIMKYNAFEALEDFPPISVHLISADKDTLVPNSLYHELWKRMPKDSKKSWLRIEDGEHLVLEQAPLFLAKWLQYIISKKSSPESLIAIGRSHALEYNDLQGRALKI